MGRPKGKARLLAEELGIVEKQFGSRPDTRPSRMLRNIPPDRVKAMSIEARALLLRPRKYVERPGDE